MISPDLAKKNLATGPISFGTDATYGGVSMKTFGFLFMTLSLAANLAFAQTDGPHDFGDSGIYGPKYDVIIDSLRALEKGHQQSAKTVTLGKTVDGRDLVGILISRTESPKQLVAITGAIHGNEYLNIADRLPGRFLDGTNPVFEDYLNNDGAIFVLPIQNPDGYERRRRANSNGHDLNRSFPNPGNNYKPFHQPETTLLAEWKDEFITTTGTEFKLSIDYHCCQGSLLLPWAYTRNVRIPIPEFEAHEALGRLLVAEIPGHRFGQSSTTIGYEAVGTSMDYWYDKYGALSGVLEGKYRVEKNNFEAHVRWWTNMIDQLN
jgi:hypothetical protein